MEIRIVYVVTGNQDQAITIGRKLVDSNLAACVNILPKMVSIYRWKDEMTQDEETILLVKTRAQNVEKIIEVVKSNHSYECPCILSFKVDTGDGDYLSWVLSETEPGQS